MKNIRRIFYISAAFALLTAVISCSDPLSAPGGKEEPSGVIIRIAGSDGRTILPTTPIFNKYELFLQKEHAEKPTYIDNTEGIESSGVTLNLSAGNWTITLKAYQDIFKDGIGVLAAEGSAEITVNDNSLKTVRITLKPVPISEASGNGLFSFNITLPQDMEEAVLELKNESGFKEINLINENSGSRELGAGYYEMSIILKKGGQSAGWYESVHIYSGLESKADINLSDIVFTDKVYLAGKLGGIRLGTIQILDKDENLIKELKLDNENKAVRTADWIIDIPSSYIGETVYVTQVFETEKADAFEITGLKDAGKYDIDLSLIPSTPEFTNIAPWYSAASGGENPQLAADDDPETFWDLTSGPASLELDYGFNVKVNDVQLIFSDSPDAGGYSVEYWNGAAWVEAVNRNFNGNKEYGGFFKTVTATQFRLNISGINGGTIAEFGLSYTTGREPQVLQATGSYHEVSLVWKEAQKADAYKINYKYTGDGEWLNPDPATVTAADCERDASNNLKYAFKPDGHNNALKAGLELQFMVEAINDISGDYISSEEDIRARLIGPALLSPSASAATSANAITVSWNKVEGAGGYYVFRRQFDLNNNAQEGTFIVYYVPGAASGSIAVTGKGLVSGADTPTVKATAAVAGSKFTLTDSWMTDAEYNDAYKGHGTYRDQQNDIAQGKPYHYFILPVLADEPLASISYTGGATYTLQDVTVTNAASLEKTGFTVGFGQNVTATKGTYVSSGNVNNGVQITWNAPPLLSGAGVTPQYTLYRKASNGSWESVNTTPLSATQHISTNETKGIVYEYAVGVNGSRPDTSARFLTDSRAQLDGKGIPKPLGYMLEMVKLQSVSREPLIAGGEFAERVTMLKNDNQYYNKGIDGYTVYLLNRNINNGRQWITLGDVESEGDGTEKTQENYHINFDNRLKVLRDYRHYYYMRSFVNNNGNKIYNTDYMPPYLWTDGAENDNVKWGARQVSAEEFAAITALSIGTGMNWAGSLTSDVPDRRSDHNVSFSEGNLGYDRDINFNNSKPYFVTVKGTLYGHCGATAKTPIRYGAYCNGIGGATSSSKDKLSTLTITGPGDVNGMYSGTVKILRLDKDSGNGPYKVSYNGQNDQGVDAKHYRTCFTFSENSKEYKRTRNFDWSPSTGIDETKNIGPNKVDKWWYRVTDTAHAGWD